MKKGIPNPARLPAEPSPRRQATPTPAGLPARIAGPASVLIPIQEGRGFDQLEAQQDIGNVQHTQLTLDIEGGSLDISLGYRRCFDFDPTNSRGQDSLMLRVNTGKIVGIVADGVSQSFFGDIAARGLSRGLMEELWNAGEVPPSLEMVDEALYRLEPVVAREVEAYLVPQHLPEMQLQALDRARTRGSQAVFAAFVLYPRQRLLALYQAGDVTAIISGDVAQLECDPRGRWSTAGSNRLLLAGKFVHGCGGILLKSDGAGDAWGKVPSRAALSSQAFAELAREQAAKDDVAFLSVQFSAGTPMVRPLEFETVQPPARYAPPRELPERKGEIIDILARSNAPSPTSPMNGRGRTAENTAPPRTSPAFRSEKTFKKIRIPLLAFWGAGLISLGLLCLFVLPWDAPPENLLSAEGFLAGFSVKSLFSGLHPFRSSSTTRKTPLAKPVEALDVTISGHTQKPSQCGADPAQPPFESEPDIASAVLCLIVVQQNIGSLTILADGKQTIIPVTRVPFYETATVSLTHSDSVTFIASTSSGPQQRKEKIEPYTWYVITLGKENN